MRQDFIQISGENFTLNGQPLLLRGYTFGTWMNLEHFMMGLPGPHSMIHAAFEEVYGKENADAFFLCLHRQMISDGDAAMLKSMGINTIRIPFNYHYFMDDSRPGVWLEEGFTHLEEAVALCRRHGLYAILDLHAAPGGQNNDWHADNITGQSLFWKYGCFQQQTCQLWQEIARRFADDPWIAGYDVINEPGYDLTKEQFNGFYNQVVQAIRQVDKDHIIFLEGDDFGRSFDLFDEPEDPQITYAVHFYPFVIEEDVLDPAMPPARRDEIFEEIFYRQLKVRQRFHRPIWCGESGYNIPDGQEDFYAGLLLKNITLCEDNNLSWSLWTYKDARRMGIVIPREDSPWIRLRRRLEAKWSHEWEQEHSMKIIRGIGEKLFEPLDDHLAYDLDFRIRSVMHRIAVEQVLKPALRTIPFEELMTLPASFAYENCDHREEVIRRLSEFIAQRSGHQA